MNKIKLHLFIIITSLGESLGFRFDTVLLLRSPYCFTKMQGCTLILIILITKTRRCRKLGEAVLTNTHNLCFGPKIRKIGIPLHTPVLLYKSGFRGRGGGYITRTTCFRDALILSSSLFLLVSCFGLLLYKEERTFCHFEELFFYTCTFYHDSFYLALN